MRRDIDPIKIIQILPFSNRPEKPPEGPNPWSEMLKQALRAIREASARSLTTIQGYLARIRLASSSLSKARARRVERRQTAELPPREPTSESSAEPLKDFSAHPAEPSADLHHHAPNAILRWPLSFRESVRAAWLVRWARLRARLDGTKEKLAVGTSKCGQTLRLAWGTQESWRNKTEQVIRPLTSAVRSLRRRHQHLLDQLNSTHSIVQSQQQEITELAFHLASVKKEMAAHKKTIVELTNQLQSLRTQMAQALPTTHGTTGQSGPSSHGRRGTAATKRNEPHDPGPQTRQNIDH
jgi:hypothetical protein